MPTLDLEATYNATSFKSGSSYSKFEGGNNQIGVLTGGDTERMPIRFSLASLPAGSTVTAASLRVENHQGFGTRDAVDCRIYGSAGTTDPATDSNQTTYDNCGSGSLLVNNSSAFFPTPGGGTVTLDVIAAASSIAAAAGGNWSLALLYDDESDPVTADQLNNIRGYDNATPANRPLLSITYVLGGDGHLWVPRLRVHAGLIGR